MVPLHHAAQAYALATLGRFEEAGRESELVREELRAGTEKYFWPESLRWLGDYLRQVPGTSPEAVESCYAQALSHARAQGARSWELGAAISLARLWAERGERGRAIGLLAPLREGFSEGADTPGPREATALIKSLN